MKAERLCLLPKLTVALRARANAAPAPALGGQVGKGFFLFSSTCRSPSEAYIPSRRLHAHAPEVHPLVLQETDYLTWFSLELTKQGPFKTYVDLFLPFFGHLPTSILEFLTLIFSLDTNWHFLDNLTTSSCQRSFRMTQRWMNGLGKLESVLEKFFWCAYTAGWNVWGEWSLAWNQDNHKNFEKNDTSYETQGFLH